MEDDISTPLNGMSLQEQERIWIETILAQYPSLQVEFDKGIDNFYRQSSKQFHQADDTTNLKKLVHFLQLGGTQNNPISQCALGELYNHGYGVEKNPTEAVKCFQLAANQGYAEAQNNLGVCYAECVGVPLNISINYFEAFKYFQLAASQGAVEAQNNLGHCYYTGFGVTSDLKQAFSWHALGHKLNLLDNRFRNYVIEASQDSDADQLPIISTTLRKLHLENLKDPLQQQLAVTGQWVAIIKHDIGNFYQNAAQYGISMTEKINKFAQYFINIEEQLSQVDSLVPILVEENVLTNRWSPLPNIAAELVVTPSDAMQDLAAAFFHIGQFTGNAHLDSLVLLSLGKDKVQKTWYLLNAVHKLVVQCRDPLLQQWPSFFKTFKKDCQIPQERTYQHTILTPAQYQQNYQEILKLVIAIIQYPEGR